MKSYNKLIVTSILACIFIVWQFCDNARPGMTEAMYDYNNRNLKSISKNAEESNTMNSTDVIIITPSKDAISTIGYIIYGDDE